MFAIVQSRASFYRASNALGPNVARAFSKESDGEGFMAKLSKMLTFKPDRGIVEIEDLSAGARKSEVSAAEHNKMPIMPPIGAGTKEKPIEVPSRLDCRTVGYEDPETHAIYWFNLNGDKLHYVTPLDKYFVLTRSAAYGKASAH